MPGAGTRRRQKSPDGNRTGTVTLTEDNFSTLLASLQQSQVELCTRLIAEIRHDERRESTPLREPAGVMAASAGASAVGANFATCQAKFSGSPAESVENFVDAVEVFKTATGISDDTALKGLPLLLSHTAGTWWQGVKNDIVSWKDALLRLKSTFGDRRPPFQIYKDLFAMQQSNKNTDLFVSQARALLAKLPRGDLNEKVELDMVYGLLDIRVRKRIDRESVSTFDDLLRRARSVEDAIREQRSAPPPGPPARGAYPASRASQQSSWLPPTPSPLPPPPPTPQASAGAGWAPPQSAPQRSINQQMSSARQTSPSQTNNEEVMRRVACADVCPAPLAPPAQLHPANRTSENKELLRQQLLSASKARVDKGESPKPKHRSRQKNRWKLKFHHQALPQEYLDHYEQSLQKANKTKKPEKPKTEPIDLNNITNETFKIWAQRLAGIQNETGSLTVPQIQNMAKAPRKDEKKKNPAIAPSKIVTYDDLPYMGEMTLNNSKPRRGRKPKKADICHLIYENYGTVVPGQPPPQVDRNQLSLCPPFRTDAMSTPKTDLQNKIISNLLERKLSQENKKRLESLTPPQFASPDEPMPEAPVTIAGPLHSDEEPLNLCIRDLHELKIQIQKKFGNIYTSMPEVKTEPETEIIEDKEQPNAISVIQRNTNLPPTASSSPDLSRQTRNVSPTLSEPAQSTVSPDGEGKFPGYVYWPNAGIYMHPLALQTQLLYYQRLAASGQLPFSAEDQERLSTPNSVSESVSTEPSPPVEDNKKKLVLKQISELLDPNVIKKTEERKTPDLSKMKRASPNPVPVQAPVKRKRSAIFIPPVPTKTNSTTPTTEVSICKFKFTGGSKPSLQEKKMLSVDSGGNFRYYSGTGNKGNKGYDYLHRDSNQGRAQLAEASASNQPKAEAPTTALSKEDLSKKKRKSRKSLQREKLEQTFKEKGFLIQTQQLQSAEGATYCKFRQLRKFTRYLFRSWKDYLPGELDERTGEAANPQPSPSEGPASEWG